MTSPSSSIISFASPLNFDIAIPYKGFWSIQVCDMLGSVYKILLKNEWVNESILTYHLESTNLPAGTYMIMVKDEGACTHWVEKLIKRA